MWKIVKPVSVRDSVLTIRPENSSPVSNVQIRLFDPQEIQSALVFTFDDITTEYSLDIFPALVYSGYIEVGTTIRLYYNSYNEWIECDTAVVTA